MTDTIIFDWGDTVMRDFPELKTPMYTWEFVESIPYIEEALSELKNNFTIVIATNAGQSNTLAMQKALQRVNLFKYFNYFFSSKDLGYEKPDINFFLTICKNISKRPEECIMVGNNFEKDILGAQNAGMKTILYDENCKTNNNKFDILIISSMKYLVKAVSEICNKKNK